MVSWRPVEASDPDLSAAAEVFDLRRAYWRNGYRPVPIYKQKRPRGAGWRVEAHQNPPVWADRFPEADALGTGLATGTLVAADVDVLIQPLSDRIVWDIEQLLGPTSLTRIGQEPKVLLAYRSDERFRKLSTGTFTMPDGTEAKVEILADGQMFVADGIHPDTGKPYVWPAGSPESVPLDAVPTITLDQAKMIIETARKLLVANGGNDNKLAKPNGADVPCTADQPTTHDALLASALVVVSGADDYNTWIAVGAALHGATGGNSAGLELWDAWSRSSAKYDAQVLRAKWASFGHYPDSNAAAGTIFRLAKQHGWRFPKRHSATSSTPRAGVVQKAQPHPPTNGPQIAGSPAQHEGHPLTHGTLGGGDDERANANPEPQPGSDWGEPPPPRSEDDDFVLPLEFSENMLAYLFSEQHAERLVYVHGWGKWMRWENGRWREDYAIAVFNGARKICAREGERALRTLDRRTAKKVAAAINKAACVAAIERLARHHAEQTRPHQVFDKIPGLLNGPSSSTRLKGE